MNESRKKALGIHREVLVDSRFLPENGERINKLSFTPLPSTALQQFYDVLKQKGEFRQRYGTNGCEKDSTFQQILPIGVIMKGDRFFIYPTGRNTLNNVVNGRPTDIMIGLNAHIDERDADIETSIYRELGRKMDITRYSFQGRAAETQVFPDPNEFPGVEELEKFIKIEPVGLINDELIKNNKRHIGLVCLVKPVNSEVGIMARGVIHESGIGKYVSVDEYREMIRTRKINPTAWADILFDDIIFPRVARRNLIYYKNA